MPGLGLGLGLETPRRRLGRASLAAAMALVQPTGHWNSVEGPGWIGTNGSMGEPGIGDPVGLLPDVSQWGGKKQAAFIAGQAELPASTWPQAEQWADNGNGSWTADGSQGAAIDLRDSNYFTAGKNYLLTFTVTGTSNVVVGFFGTSNFQTFGNGTHTRVFTALTGLFIFRVNAGVAGTVGAIAVKELPGNHAKAGTWAAPSDTARPTRGDGFLNYNGSNNYSSLLNPVPLTDIGAIIHVCARSSNGIVTAGTGKDGSFSGSMWYSNNRQYHGIRDTWLAADANLFTGPLVFTNWIDGADEVLRLNGVEISRVPVGPRTTSLHFLGRSYTYYHNGPQHAVQHLPPGVDVAMIEAWEAYGRSLNGAVFP